MGGGCHEKDTEIMIRNAVILSYTGLNMKLRILHTTFSCKTITVLSLDHSLQLIGNHLVLNLLQQYVPSLFRYRC